MGQFASKCGVGEGRTSQATGQARLADLLFLAGRFGGIVTADLAAYALWPTGPANRVKLAEALIRRACAAGLLRRHQGHPVASLTMKSADHMGMDPDGWPWHRADWSPPPQIWHDLRAARLLLKLQHRGWKYISDWEIKSANQGMLKRPDALVGQPKPDGTTRWWWVEVEGARKTGRHMADLAQALEDAACGQAPWIRNWANGEVVTPRAALVCYSGSAHDERKCRLNHRDRIEAALIRRKPITPFCVYFAEENEKWQGYDVSASLFDGNTYKREDPIRWDWPTVAVRVGEGRPAHPRP